MTSLAEELRALAAKRRNKNVLAEIQEKLAEIRGHYDDIEPFADAAGAAVTALNELQGVFEQVDPDNPLVPGGLTADDIGAMLKQIPGGDSDDETGIGQLLDDADAAAESYEEIADDRDYDGDARAEAWGELVDELENIANWLDPAGRRDIMPEA